MTLTPGYYDPAQVGILRQPEVQAAIAEGQSAGLTPAAEDRELRLLLLVDAQVDFVHADGALSVPGAVGDARRTVEWLYRNCGQITSIVASLDSHVPIQIFYPTWWQDPDGRHPSPYTPISAQEVDSGRWSPRYETDWSAEYVHRLEEQARRQLMIWPYHTMIGTAGHGLTPDVYEAIVYHAAARQAQPRFVLKGMLPRTEYYSLLEPEVKAPEHPSGRLNEDLLTDLLGYDRVYVAGQAKSHCVLETLSTIVRQVGEDPTELGRFYLLTDCTSSVQHPEIDFEALANKTYARYAAHGLNLITSADPLG